MKNIPKILLLGTMLAAPPLAFAAAAPQSIMDIVRILIGLLLLLVPLLAGFPLFWLIFGLSKLIANAGNETAREEGKQVMIWGIIGVFVVFSIWGILVFLHGNVFNSSPDPLGIPQLPTSP